MNRTFKMVLVCMCLSLILLANGVALAKELTPMPVSADEAAMLEAQPAAQDVVAGHDLETGEVALIVIAGALVVIMIIALAD